MKETKPRTSVLLLFALLPLLSFERGHAQDILFADARPRFLIEPSRGARPVEVDASRIAALSRKVVLYLDNARLEDALDELASQTGVRFVYVGSVLPLDTRVQFRSENMTVAAALTELLFGLRVDVVVSGNNQLAIVRRVIERTAPGKILGRVTETQSERPVVSAQVFVEGTSRNALTDQDGRFAIDGVPPGRQRVTVSLIGYKRTTQEVEVGDGATVTLDFALTVAPTALSELVVTATGEQRRVELGHVVGRINADSIVRQAPISTLSELLNGRVTGLQVNTHQGTVGGDVSLQIRGPNTIQLSNEPIVIVDGIRYTSRAAARVDAGINFGINTVEPTSPLNDLNPNEIQSIEVVKGPSAATLYGTDAANGVIVITTKRGQPGPARWNAYVRSAITEIPDADYPDAYWGWRSVGGVPVTDRWSSCALVSVAFGQCTQDSVTVITNPLESAELTMFESKPRWQYGLNVSGGSEAFRYFASGDFEQALGPIRMPSVLLDSLRAERPVPDEQIHPNALSLLNLRTNLGLRLPKIGDVQLHAAYTGRSTRTMGSNFSNPYTIGLTEAQVNEPYGAEGPDEFFARTTHERTDRLFTSATITLPVTAWLQARVTGGLDLTNIRRNSLVRRGDAPEALNGLFELGSVAEDRGRQLVTTAEIAASATHSFGRFAMRTSVGSQFVRNVEDLVGSTGNDLAPGATTISAAANIRSRQQYREMVTLGSYAEQMFGLNQRLFVTGALRVDGASTFGRNYDAVAYPKAGVSWLLSEEPFMPRLPLLDELRVRYAYGASGQQPLPEWSRPEYVVDQAKLDGTIQNVFTVNGLGNPDLRPERVKEYEFGFDATLFNRRAEFAFTWYRRSTIDQIVSVNLPPGLGSIRTNLGKTSGRGFEASLNAHLLDSRKAAWTASLQYSFQRTILDDLGSAAERESEYGGWVEGYPLGARFAFPFLGHTDANGDGLIQPVELQYGEKKVFVGESRPPRWLSLSTTLGLMDGRVRVSGMLERRSGFTQFNALLRSQCSNQLCRAAVDPTAAPDDIALATAVRFKSGLNAFIEPGDYTRLREVTVMFDVTSMARWLPSVSSGWLSVQARNLALWTAYPGADPESATLALSLAQETGIPQARSWAVRFDLAF